LQALNELRGEYSFAIKVIDVDADEALIAQYDELVPVLVACREGKESTRLCHYFFDEAKVRAFLDAP